MGPHLDHVSKERAASLGLDFVPVSPIEARWSREAEDHALALLVGFDGVADRPVAAGRTNAQGPVELQGRPPLMRPETVRGGSEGIEKTADLSGRSRDGALVNVVDDHEEEWLGIRRRTMWSRLRNPALMSPPASEQAVPPAPRRPQPSCAHHTGGRKEEEVQPGSAARGGCRQAPAPT